MRRWYCNAMRESRWLPSLLEVFRVKRLWRPFFVSVGELALRHYFIVLTHPTHSCLRSSLQLVHFKGVHLSQVPQLINTCTNRSLFGTAETAAPHDSGRCLQILVDATCIFQPLITSKPIGCAAAGRYGRFFLQPICICRYLV